jgi:hypothetical protein
MSTLRGRWRCDHQPVATDRLPPIVTWHATEAAANEHAATCKGGKTVVWFWPGEYIETDAEEAVRMMREALQGSFGWLRLPWSEGDAA